MSVHSSPESSKRRWRWVVLAVLLMASSLTAVAWVASARGWRISPAKTTQVQTAAVLTTVPSFVVQGLPVSLSPGAVSTDGSLSTLTYSVTNQSGNKVTNARLLLLEFNPAGKLRRAEGWIESLNLNTSATTQISISLKKRVTPGQRLVLAVEAVTGSGGTREVAPVDLIEAVAASLGGSSPPPPTVHTNVSNVTGDYGSIYCNNALRAAMTGSKASDSGGISAFSCKPGSRFYAFSYNR